MTDRSALRSRGRRHNPPRGPEDYEHPIVTSVCASGADCIGCQTWEKPVMVSFGTNYDGVGSGIQHHDFFLTEGQAERLLYTLVRSLGRQYGQSVVVQDGEEAELTPRVERLADGTFAFEFGRHDPVLTDDQTRHLSDRLFFLLGSCGDDVLFAQLGDVEDQLKAAEDRTPPGAPAPMPSVGFEGLTPAQLDALCRAAESAQPNPAAELAAVRRELADARAQLATADEKLTDLRDELSQHQDEIVRLRDDALCRVNSPREQELKEAIVTLSMLLSNAGRGR